MKKKIFLLILATLCMIFALCSCSCTDNTDEPTPSIPSTNQSSGAGNGDTQPPSNEPACRHYWKDVTIDKATTSTSSVYLNGECYLCGDKLFSESVSTVTYEEWKNALSPENVSSFTVYSAGNYTDYDKTHSMSWRIKDNVYTEDYYIGVPGKNSQSYLTENYSGYITASYFNKFAYNKETKTYIYKINENSSVELGFADGNLIYHATTTAENGNETKIETLYLNHNKVYVSAPEYLFKTYFSMVEKDSLALLPISEEMAEKLSAFLKSMTFDGNFEASFLENGRLCVYLNVNSDTPDPIFNEQYDFVSVDSKDGKVTSVTIGNNTISFN